MSKTIIYQVLPRLYGNRNTTRKPNGTIEENGCGKLEDFTDKELKKIGFYVFIIGECALPSRSSKGTGWFSLRYIRLLRY